MAEAFWHHFKGPTLAAIDNDPVFHFSIRETLSKSNAKHPLL
jgi:hypothetical protein